MNAMFEKAIAEIRKRPEPEQEAIGEMLIDDMKNRDALRQLLLERRESVKAGNVVDGEEMFARLRKKHFPDGNA